MANLFSSCFLKCGAIFNKAGALFWKCAHLPGLTDLSPKAALNGECHPNEYVPSLQMQPAHRQACCSGTESIWCVLFHCLSFPEVSGIFYQHKEYLIFRKASQLYRIILLLVYFLIFPHYTSMLFLRYSPSIHYQSDNFFFEGYTVFITFLINPIAWLCG